jgi:mRNA-degrading endonuclease RelE of RelBE toxin-antitoxin system
MVEVIQDPLFQKKFLKIKDNSISEQIKKKIVKIIDNPEIGKPMRYGRKGTREIYIGSLRLSYVYLPSERKIYLLDIYHKDKQ